MKSRRLFALLLAVLMMSALLAACGGSSEGVAMDSMAMDAPQAEAPEEEVFYSGSTADAPVADSAGEVSQQKLIKTVYMDTETEDLDPLLEQLSRQISAVGGYVENQEIYNGSSRSSYRYRSANLTIRIPAEKLNEFVGGVQGVSNVINYNESTEDVTLTYVSTESRIAALETEQERLLELLAKAENMTDLLEIEQRLTEVRYELENVTSRLRVLSNQVSYATVHLSIEQVKVYTEVEEQTVWQRIGSGFSTNLRNIGEGLVDFFVWVVTYSPQLLFWAVVIAAGVCIFRRAARKHRAAKKPPVPKDQENP